MPYIKNEYRWIPKWK